MSQQRLFLQGPRCTFTWWNANFRCNRLRETWPTWCTYSISLALRPKFWRLALTLTFWLQLSLIPKFWHRPREWPRLRPRPRSSALGREVRNLASAWLWGLTFGFDIGLGVDARGRGQNVEAYAEDNVTRPRPR